MERPRCVVAELHDEESAVAGGGSFELSDEDATEDNEDERYEDQVESLFVVVRYPGHDPQAWQMLSSYDGEITWGKTHQQLRRHR